MAKGAANRSRRFFSRRTEHPDPGGMQRLTQRGAEVPPLELWGEQDRAPARGGGQAEMAALGLGENMHGCTWVWKEKKIGKEK